MNLLIICSRGKRLAKLSNTALHKYKPENAYIISRDDMSNEIDYSINGFFSSLDIWRGEYESINECQPLDSSIIASMNAYEPTIMKMLERTKRHMFFLRGEAKLGINKLEQAVMYLRLLTHRGSTKIGWLNDILSYDERKRFYYLHLRYWNDFLDSNHIDGVICFDLPHWVYDYIIYALCAVKGIARVMCYHFFTLGTYFFKDINDPLPAFTELYRKNEKEFASKNLEDIPLLESYEKHFRLMSGTDNAEKTPWYMRDNPERVSAAPANNTEKAVGRGFFKTMRSAIFPVLLSAHTKRAMRRLTRVYSRFTITPDFSIRYIYFPLVKQPEASSCPMGDVFVDQLLAIEMIAACLPEGTLLYVKENPKQTEYCRDTNLYSDIARLPNVKLVPQDTDTYELIEHCVAVAGLSNTAGFEGLMVGKPFLMFSYKYAMYAKGTFRIATNEECKQALDYVFKHGARHTLWDMRLYYRTISALLSPSPITNTRMIGDDSSSKWLSDLAAVFDPQLN